MQIQIWTPGEKIKDNRFEIIKVLGIGGFGITYLASDEKRKQQVVIKTLNITQQGEPDFESIQEKFVNEGMILKSFDHAHIVKSYELIHVGSLWGLVMEYIPGKELKDYVREQGRLSETEALGYIDQIAQALDFVHQKKFFHRDVKPDNIMLRQHQQQEAVLIDFGIAKEYAEHQTVHLSNSLGTEFYKPIEQYEQSGRFGPYTDIYALAVTLYHLISGDAPGGGSPLYTSKARKDAQDKGWGASIDEHLWGELTKVGISERTLQAIQAGMQIEPSQRPQSMTEFRELLELVKTEIIISNSDFFADAENCFEEGKRLEKSRDYNAAICKFDRAIELNPQNANYYTWRGTSKYNLKDYPGAISDFTTATELNPQKDDCYYWRGTSKYNLKDYPGAIADFTTAIELNPQNANYYYWRGTSKHNLKDYPGAISDFTTAIELNPQKDDYYDGRGTSKYNLKDYSGAIADFTMAIELNPQKDSYYDWRGTSKYNLKDYPGAIADFTTAIELNPQKDGYYDGRGTSKYNLKDYPGAISDYTTAIELNPQKDSYYDWRSKAKSKICDH